MDARERAHGASGPRSPAMNSPCYGRATQACFRFLSLRIIFGSGEKRALALARHEEVCMRIAIIGAGSVGATVGRAWIKHGEDVIWGLRDPADPKYAALPKDRRKAPAEAVKGCETLDRRRRRRPGCRDHDSLGVRGSLIPS